MTGSAVGGKASSRYGVACELDLGKEQEELARWTKTARWGVPSGGNGTARELSKSLARSRPRQGLCARPNFRWQVTGSLWEDAEVGKVANGARLPASRKHIPGPNTGQGLWGTFLLVSSICLSRSVHMGSWGPRPMNLPFTWGAFKKVEGCKRDSDYVRLEQDRGIRIFQSPPHDPNGLCS